MKNYRQQLSANAEDFDSIINEMLKDYEQLQADNDRLRGEMENTQRLIRKSFWEGAETQAYTDEPINITYAWYESRARKELLEIQDKNNES